MTGQKPPTWCRGLHAYAARVGLSDRQLRAVVLDITAGRTSSTKEITAAEAVCVNQSIRDCERSPGWVDSIVAGVERELGPDALAPSERIEPPAKAAIGSGGGGPTGSIPVGVAHPSPSGQPAEPGISDAQLKKLHALFNNHGITGDDRHTTLSRMLGRQVASTKELTKVEAIKVIDSLESAEPQRPDVRSRPQGPNPLVNTVRAACKRKGLEGDEADAMVRFATGKPDLQGIETADEANAVMEALTRFGRDELALRYRDDGVPEIHETKPEQGVLT